MKRYNCGNGEGMFEETNGQWVEWSEYQKLNEDMQRLLKQTHVSGALLAAGKLALSARLVTTANAKNLSQRIELMGNVLDAYNNEILSLSNDR